MRRISQIFRDRPLSALDTAIFWVEYVVRNGKNSLRSPALDLTWWQINLLDVYAVILLCLFGTVAAVAAVGKYLFKLLVQGLGSDEKLAKKQR